VKRTLFCAVVLTALTGHLSAGELCRDGTIDLFGLARYPEGGKLVEGVELYEVKEGGGLRVPAAGVLQADDAAGLQVRTVDRLPRPEDTFIGYGRGWANVSNTPFREYKHFSHEGGISTPLIVHWPDGIDPARQGKLVREPGHVIDIMATCVDVAGVEYPLRFAGHKILPLEGVSLRPAFSGGPLRRADALYFEHHLNCAVRDGDWKLVRKGRLGRPCKLLPWELYDMSKDRSELHDLSAKHPEKVAELSGKWEAWAARARVKPWPWEFEEGR